MLESQYFWTSQDLQNESPEHTDEYDDSPDESYFDNEQDDDEELHYLHISSKGVFEEQENEPEDDDEDENYHFLDDFVYLSRHYIELELKLQNRPNPQELLACNIIKTQIAPALQATHTELTRRSTKLIVNKQLGHRPSMDDLIQHNILKPPTCSPILQARQQVLKKVQTKVQLENKMRHRAAKDDLVEHNIIKRYDVANSLQAAQQALAFKKNKHHWIVN